MKRLKRWLKNEPGLKIVSLVLAIILWFYIAGEMTEELPGLKIPLRIIPPEDMVVLNQDVETLEVVLRGPGNVIRLLRNKDIEAIHTVKEAYTPGIYTVSIQDKDLNLPKPVKVISIDPSTVTFTLDRLIQKKLKVKARLTGQPAPSYIVVEDKIKLNPEACMVTGPQSILKNLSYVRTEPISLVGISATFTRKVYLEPLIKNKRPSDISIEVTVPIQTQMKTRQFKDIAVKIMGNLENISASMKLNPQVVDLEVSSPDEILDTLSRDDIKAYVEVEKLSLGKYMLPLQVILPAGSILVSEMQIIELEIGVSDIKSGE